MRWGTVVTADEPAALLRIFIGHHLRLGAAEVHVFLDRPDPEAVAMLAGLPGCDGKVFLTICDAAYWRDQPRGSRPPRHTARQKANATRVYREAGLDWLLHCDADEFLLPEAGVGGMGALLDELAAAAPEFDHLMVPVAERVRLRPVADPGRESVFEGALRLPVEDARAIHGPDADYLNDGLTGHRVGKGIVRGGRDLEMGVHFPVPDGMPRVQRLLRGARLAHFDGLTPLHLALKLLRRASERYPGPPRPHGAHRIRQFSDMAARAASGVQWRDLAERLQTLPEAAAARLEAQGALLRLPLPALLGAADAPLTVAAFDRALIAREAAFLAELEAAFGFSPE